MKIESIFNKHSGLISNIVIIVSFIIVLLPYFRDTGNETDPYISGVRNPYTGWYTYEDDEKVIIEEDIIKLDRKAYEPVSVYGVLPEISEINNTLFFRSVDQVVRVYIGEELIYSFGEEIPVPFVKTPGDKWNIIRLETDMSYETVRIETISPYESTSGKYSELYLIPINEVNDIIFDSGYYNLFFAGLLFVIGFGMLGLSAVNAANENYSIINISAQLYIVISIWVFAESHLMGSIIKEPLTIYFVNMFALLIAPILFFRYLKAVDKKHEKLLQHLVNIFVVNAILCILIEIFTTEDMSEFVYLVAVIMIITISVYVAVSFTDIIKSKFQPELVVRWLPLLFVVIGGTVDIINVIVFHRTEHIGVIFAVSICVYVFFNINMLLQEEQKMQKREIKLRSELMENRRRLLLSQIKPHFLYNSLNSISALCKFDPDLADQAIIKFSRYLRNNMNSIDAENFISFESELEHVKNYVFLEQIRFPDAKIDFNLEYTDFELPPLTLQPIVENAIKHGISKKVGGGTVLISTKCDDEYIHIEIKDDGVGFDTESKRKSDSIGLKNITKRLEDKCEALITVGSEVGVGTRIEIIMPREREIVDEDTIC